MGVSECLKAWSSRGRILLAAAAPKEIEAVAQPLGVATAHLEPWRVTTMNDRFDLLMTGVGKANAAGAVARAFDPSQHVMVVNLGVAGALPDAGVSIGDVVIGAASVFADEGITTDERFQDIADVGFPPFPSGKCACRPPSDLLEVVDDLGTAGVIATVSACSGSDAQARDIRSRTGAVAEAMEGAAIGLAVAWVNSISGGGAPFLEIRTISNTTGNRAAQVWDLPAALASLSRVAAHL